MLFPKGGGHRRQLVPVDNMNIRTCICNTLKNLQFFKYPEYIQKLKAQQPNTK